MEGRVVLLNGDMIAVRLLDSSYSVFRLVTGDSSANDIEIGDSFLGTLSCNGPQTLLHCRTQTWIEVRIKLARSNVAARTKRFLINKGPVVAR